MASDRQAIKYSNTEAINISRQILHTFTQGIWTIAMCCDKFDISKATFAKWASPKADVEGMLLREEPLPELCIPEVHFMYRKAKQSKVKNYKNKLGDAARQALLKRVQGYQTEEVQQEFIIDTNMMDVDGNPNPDFGKRVLVKEKVKISSVAPDVNAIIFALTNVDTENFKNRTAIDTSGTVVVKNDLSNMTDAELEETQRKLESRLHKLKSSNNDHIQDADVIDEDL